MSPPPDRFVEGWHDLDIYGSLTQELKEEIQFLKRQLEYHLIEENDEEVF